MADPIDDYKSLKSRGGGFLLGKRGSTWMAEILPPTRVPSVPKLLRGPTGPQPGVGGTWALVKGEPVFTVTCRRGTLELNSLAAMELKRLIGVSTAPTLQEAPQVEVLDPGAASDAPPDAGLSPGVSGPDLEALDALDSLDAAALSGPGEPADKQADDLQLDGLDALDGLDIPPPPPPPPVPALRRPSGPDLGSLDTEALDFLGALDDGVERGDGIKAAQARLAWVQARDRARRALEGFGEAILKDFPGEEGTVNGLRSALSGLSSDLEDALDRLINAGNIQDSTARKTASDKHLSEIDDALTDAEAFVRDDDVLTHLDDSPYGKGQLQAPLLKSLGAIRTSLGL